MSRAAAAKKKYSPDVLAEAAKLVQSGSVTLSTAARSYGIPKSTLHDAVKSKYATNRTGPGTVLSEVEEQRLADWVIQMARIGYGRTRQELLTTVKKIIDMDGRKTPFNGNRPGKDWFYGFCKRHPEISVRSTMQLGKERAVITPESISSWFTDLRSFLEADIEDPTLISDPSRIYNADESGFPLSLKNGKVLSMKGAKHVYNLTSSNKTQITVLACASAIGHFVKPMIVYPGQRFGYDILAGFEDAAFGRSDNGWMDSELFLTWLTSVFIPELDMRNVKRPVLLFVDGHTTHVTLEASNACRENGIHMYCLLEHASHLIQPLDLRFFSILKDNWYQAVRDFQLQNIPQTVTKKNFASVFKTAWEKSATLENAIKAFKHAGLFPLDENVVLRTAKMEPSKVFSSKKSSFLSTGADTTTEAVVTTSAEFPANGALVVTQQDDANNLTPTADNAAKDDTRFSLVNHDPPLQSNESMVVGSPSVITLPVNESGPGSTDMLLAAAAARHTTSDVSDTIAADPRPASATDVAPPSPFSKFLVLPKSDPKKNREGKRREKMPKAVTGDKFRKILLEKKQEKAKMEQEKNERKEKREAKRKQREEEIMRKQKERQEKKMKKAEEKERKLKEKEIKRKLASLKRKHESSSSESDGHMSLNDSSEVDLDISQRACYKCDAAYDDTHPLDWVACGSCPRLFHKRCTDINFDIMTTDEAADYPFECLFC